MVMVKIITLAALLHVYVINTIIDFPNDIEIKSEAVKNCKNDSENIMVHTFT